MIEQRLDMLIFAASGFTGKYTVKEAARLCKKYSFTWGVADRNRELVESTLKKFAPGFEHVPVIIADVEDYGSLKKMAGMCKVVINCCGPYKFYGEPVVQACIESGTHHVDVSGEPLYMEKMELLYNEIAKTKGIYIISACGFDSIPCDLGTIFTQQKFPGELNSVEAYLNGWYTYDKKTPSVNYGTWKSAVYGLSDAYELKKLRSKLFAKKWPTFEPILQLRAPIHRSEVSEGWSVRFLGADRAVTYRSQRFLYEHDKIRPTQIKTYITFRSWITFFSTLCGLLVVVLLSKCKYGRNLVLKYPRFFSNGFASFEGPDLESMENAHISMTFDAKGWKDKLAEPTDKHTEPMNKRMVTRVTATNPGYGATGIMVILAALTILREAHRMPNNGGVLPPGAAFAKTSYIDRLNDHNVKFEVISSSDM